MTRLRGAVSRTAFALACALAVIWLACVPARAVNPDEILSDPALEARARHLSAELRCLVCRNQSIDDSNADLARDLRLLVRRRLVAGDTDAQAKAYIVARYGNFVLLKPPVQWDTAALWAGPGLFLVVAAFGAFLYVRARAKPTGSEPAPALTPEEQARVDTMLARQEP